MGHWWRRYAIKLVLAGEVFSENWRSLVGKRVGASTPATIPPPSMALPTDAFGQRTPLSICIRRYLAQSSRAAGALFEVAATHVSPVRSPLSRFFEVHDGTPLFRK